MKVSLLTCTERPEKIVAAAAKLCYSNAEVDDLMDKLTPIKIEGFLNRLSKIGHESPFEHISFTFAIEGISRACSHQLVRHRIASYSQQSQRYVNLKKTFAYVEPKAIQEDAKASREFHKIMKDIHNAYEKITELLKEEYIADGYDEKTSEKMSIEDARYVLPNACETKIIVTMNARALMNFFKLRCCNRAQWEIRELADKMLEICKEKAPNIFKYAGAACMHGQCSEGEMTCGKPRRSV